MFLIMIWQKKLSFLSLLCLFLTLCNFFCATSTFAAMYTYTGTHELISDGGGTYRIKLKTGGTFKPANNMTVAVFLVGGGGGGSLAGGGGGYTRTQTNISLTGGSSYSITVGGGGAAGSSGGCNPCYNGGNGGASSGFGYSASGGSGALSSGGWNYVGANGGSGGGGYNGCTPGGTNGSNGSTGPYGAGGTGQGTTTREFGSASGTLYSTGGAGGYNCGSDGANNTGNGGHGVRAGGSGIVVVRFTDSTAPTCGTWSPTTSPWKTSGTQAFTLSGSTDTGGSGINVAGGSCTTGSANGNTCTVTISDVAGNSRVCTSPVNRVDATAPVCGTWSPEISPWKNEGATTFTLSGSTDALSGIATAGGSCTTDSTNGSTCTVTISDNAGNSRVCTSPVNRVDATAPVCGTWSPEISPWKSSGTQTFTLSNSTDTGGSGIDVSGGTCITEDGNGDTCTVTISDNAGNSRVCTSPVNRVDAINPTCGTWSPEISPWKSSGTQTFTLSYSIDSGGSGIIIASGDCTTGENHGDTCDVEIADGAGNTRICTSPVNRVDDQVPTIVNLATAINKTTADIYVETSEPTYAKIKYGLTNALGVETPLSASLAEETVVSLSPLLACTKYFYQPLVKDVALNEEVDEIRSFTTLGCSGSEGSDEASVSAQVSNAFANDEGGSLELETETEKIKLDIPANLQASAGASLIVFQVKQLNKEQVLESVALPVIESQNSNESKLINSIFDLKAYLNTNERLSEFAEEIMITFDYTDEQVKGIDLSTLSIYRYDGEAWIRLETTIDQVNKKLVAYTNHFSLFAAFGQEVMATESNSVTSGTVNNSTSTTSLNNSSGDCLDSKPTAISDLFQIDAALRSAKAYFTPQSDTNKYFISFSALNTNAEEHGEQVELLREGVLSHTIYYLKPNTTYYLKVRGQNGCAPGDWSNIMKFKTNERIYYRDETSGALKTSSAAVKTTQTKQKKTNEEKSQVDEKTSVVIVSPTPIATIMPTLEPVPITTDKPKNEVKKWCFLWWCW